jgi:hypothetical protein
VAPEGKASGRFLKKAAQKLLLLWAGDGETSTAQFKKVFCFFFSKKKPFLPFPPPWTAQEIGAMNSAK